MLELHEQKVALPALIQPASRSEARDATADDYDARIDRLARRGKISCPEPMTNRRRRADNRAGKFSRSLATDQHRCRAGADRSDEFAPSRPHCWT